MRNERGFALLIVLWSLVFLTFLMTQIVASGRGAVALAGNLRAAAQAGAVADGAIYETTYHLLVPGAAHWALDPAPRTVMVGGVPVTVISESVAGLVNPNLASVALLAGLLRAVALPPDQAHMLAAAIIAWRSQPASPTAGAALLTTYRQAGRRYGPPGKPFAALGELTDVIGVTPAIYALIRPYLSLFQPGDPDPTLAGPVVHDALALAKIRGAAGGNTNSAKVAAITACIAAEPGLCRYAVISLAGFGQHIPFHVLALDEGKAAF